MVAPLQILSILPVTVEQDPVLAAAQPVTMASAATDMAFMARVVFNTAATIRRAVSELESQWSGEGGSAFKSAAGPLAESTAAAAAALFGGAEALSVLAQGIGDAQRMATAALLLAEQANYCLVLLQRSVRETELNGPGGGHMLFGFAPTSAQVAAAQQVLANQEQALRQMALANRNAQVAWRSAQRSFDLVTSQSPSVAAAFDNANFSVYNREISGLGMMGMAALAIGAMGGGDGGDEDGGDDPVNLDPEGDEGGTAAGDEGDGPSNPIDEELTVLDAQADAKVTVDGTALDQDVADDYNTATSRYGTLTTSAHREELHALGLPSGSLQVVGVGFSESELFAARTLSQQGRNVVLREADGFGKMSDLVVDGVAYDVYTPKTSSLNRIVGSLAKKGPQVNGGGLVIDLSNSSLGAADMGRLLARVRGVTRRVSDIIVIGG